MGWGLGGQLVGTATQRVMREEDVKLVALRYGDVAGLRPAMGGGGKVLPCLCMCVWGRGGSPLSCV